MILLDMSRMVTSVFFRWETVGKVLFFILVVSVFSRSCAARQPLSWWTCVASMTQLWPVSFWPWLRYHWNAVLVSCMPKQVWDLILWHTRAMPNWFIIWSCKHICRSMEWTQNVHASSHFKERQCNEVDWRFFNCHPHCAWACNFDAVFFSDIF